MAQNKTIIEKAKRMMLHIESVGEEKPAGRTMKLSFKATYEGNQGRYDTFVKNFFPIIKAAEGKDLDCEVEISEHEYEGDMYTDRLVNQIYIDGKPQREAKQGGYGGKHYDEDTPEKRASIEAQTVWNGIVTLLVAKIVNLSSDLGEMAQEYAKARFGRVKQVEASIPAQGVKSKPVAAKAKASEPEVKSEPKTPAAAEGGNADGLIFVDLTELADLMKRARWTEATVKSWCTSQFMKDSEGNAPNVNFGLNDFITSLGDENAGKLFELLKSKAGEK